MKKFCSSVTRLSFLIPVLYVLLLISSVQGHRFDAERHTRGLPRDQRIRQSFSASEDQIYPQVHHQSRHRSSSESNSLNSAFHHKHSERRPETQYLLQPEESAKTDFNALIELHGAPEVADMNFNVPDAEIPQTVELPRQDRRHRRRMSRTSSDFPPRISPDSTPLNDPQQPGVAIRSAEDIEQEKEASSQHHFQHRNSHSELQVDGSPLRDTDFFRRQEISDHLNFPFSLAHEGEPHSELHRDRNPQSEFQVDDSSLREANILGGEEISDHSSSLLSSAAEGDAYFEHQSSSRNERYENERPVALPQMEDLKFDELGAFSSNRRVEHDFNHYPERPLRNEDSTGRHEQHHDSRSAESSEETEEGLHVKPDYVENFPERSSALFGRDLEHQEEQAEGSESSPSLDICSEETHTFYYGEVSSSSPLYEIEPFLPPNFNELFLNELLHKFRPYEHPDVGSENSICDPNLKFDETSYSNVRAMCPFEWEVSSYNSSRYPPYLMTAQCTCQVSKPMYGEQSLCMVKKGRIPVLWRVGCNNGKHIYREGWEEINVACVPEGYMLTPGKMGREPDNFHKPPV